MMPPSFIATVTVFHSLALVVTTFRLYHRRRRKQSSWDDFWALAAVCFDTVVLVFFLVRVRNNDRTRAGHPPSRATARTNYFVIGLAVTAALWSARISIACSILRILPPGPTRSLVFRMAGLFGLVGLFGLSAKSWICAHDTSWSTDCPLTRAYIISKLSMDIMADAGLVAVPLTLLRHTSLPKGPRYMIRAVFATTIFTASIGVLRTVYGLHPNVTTALIVHIESAVTVMLCNLLVVVTFIYRQICTGGDLDDETAAYVISASQQPRPRPRAMGVSFASFSKICLTTRLTTISYLLTTRSGRGSSVFREGDSSANDHDAPDLSPAMVPREATLGLSSDDAVRTVS
ncbi:hypothetical protein LshimejAT787_1403120 [Lyophyllum shimeji]|uniref:Rhodopsin domain-containing protein n=1 Tax=Lyophyllum shimeji TaxID=47721 RepID=A0A9P3PVN8_LYOSH|nr:hypothetical protein LshimejAT787_1403120 [Lyophyllum shimeji]